MNSLTLVISSLLIRAAHASPASSPVSISYSVLIATSIALLVTAVVVKKKLSAPQEATSPPRACVLQCDEAQERLAEASTQQLPVNAAVTLKEPKNGHNSGSVRSYDGDSDTYEVELVPNETVALKSSQLQFPKVSGLFVYPIESCAGIQLDEAQLTPKGLLHDREWVIIDGARDKFVTQRRYPKLALLHPKLLPSTDAAQVTSLVLTAKGMPELEVPVVNTGEGKLRVVSVWKDKVEAVDQGDAAAEWLDTFMGEEKCGSETDSRVIPNPMPMNRFRPNIVLRGSPAFADEHWNCITIDGFQFRNVRPCARCGMPSVDQATGEVHPEREPSRAIVRERNGVLLGVTDGKGFEGYFGSNMVLEMKGGNANPPRLAVGANVKVLTLKTEVVA
ncbi:hypothetical protein PF011_g4012 [Phytophthora fragariae]|uniref:MOSC domain-containing protein n=1 Tax=Phytophthora fragariae TaxID=53985 RepID=A0A6A3LVK9_9STRA|nr:hypothetical protein PF011_g4012 [Phytophthora fragariae]